MKDKGIKKNILINTLYQILLVIIPIITAPYVSRVLGSEGIGIYSYTTSIVLYFTLFGALGTVSYGTREISKNRDNIKERSKLFWEVELLTIFTSIISIILWLIVVIIYKQYQIYLLILTLNLINTMLDISWFYSGIEEFKYTVTKNAICKIIGVICIFVFVRTKDDLFIYFLINGLTTLFGTISMWFYIKKFVIKIDKSEIKVLRHLKETFIYFIPTIATSIYTVLDKTLIGIITKDVNQNGYYEQANKIIGIMESLTFTSVNIVLESRMSYLFAQNKYDEIQKRIDKSMKYILFMGIGICFGILAISKKFVPLFFGNGFQESVELLNLMSPLVFIIGISNCLGSQFYTPAGFRKESAKYIIIGSIVNLICNLLLIPKWGSRGAVIGSIIAESIISFLYVLNSKGYMSFTKIIKFSYKYVIAGIIMMIVVLYIDQITKTNAIFVMLEVFIGITIYIISLLLMRDKFIFELKEILTNIIRKKGKNESEI